LKKPYKEGGKYMTPKENFVLPSDPTKDPAWLHSKSKKALDNKWKW
jgi:hypothetical protein